MKIAIKTILLLSTLLLICACFKPNANNTFYPIKNDNYWEYEFIHYSGGIVDSFYTYTNRYTIDSIIHIDSLDHILGAQISSSGSIALFLSNGDDGLYCNGYIVDDSIGIHEPQLRYKYPVTVGESWSSIFYNPSRIEPYYWGNTSRNISCVAIDEPFITFCDTFSTIVYYYLNKWGINGFHQHNFEFYAYGIGKVGSEAYLSNTTMEYDTIYPFTQRSAEDLQYTMKLIDYCLY